MTRLAGTSLHRTRGGRLLALLLVLLLAMGSLSSHGAMDSHALDCGITPQLEHLDAGTSDRDEPRCSACTALAFDLLPAHAAPELPTIGPASAVVAHSPLPPRRPPRA
ncbi:hypothetical protein [Halomonas heilongjiangensis]|uniref:DUF2946 domain-containing protein n=1 Tax=Halomonas heilongjiangensis TaxID=1387883 RepID=A0A2N7TG51_9GAMM|nr:hypothetical protein [Halomonas heilongjiangensis]PMR67138.1 hypothetical protein C1H66_20905 [Halomonas heilongjiangensis]PXX87877.1 hypothetical protein CR158_16175 [Halomonas heilongjiangensis]